MNAWTIKSREEVLEKVLLATVIFASIPTNFTLRMRVFGIPILDGFYIATMLAVTGAYLQRYKRPKLMVAAYVVAGIGFGIVTVAHWDLPRFDLRGAFQDVSSYSGLPVGAALGQFAGKHAFERIAKRWYAAISIIFLINLILLLLGYLQSAGGNERLLDPAMYTSSFLIAMLFPGIWAGGAPRRNFWRIVAMGGIGMNFLFAVVSATRSVLITSIAAIVCAVIIQIKRDSRSSLWIAAFVAAFAAIFWGAAGPERFEGSLLGERLASTDYQGENRFEELTMMLDQMETRDWIYGVGFGTGFESPIMRETDTGLATAPHIGIVTLLLKGGAPAMVLLMLVPCFWGISGLLLSRRGSADPFFAGIGVYFVEASISGGWSFLPLLVFGACFALSRERSQDQRRVVFPGMPEFGAGRLMRIESLPAQWVVTVPAQNQAGRKK